jgi:hypothetical protein
MLRHAATYTARAVRAVEVRVAKSLELRSFSSSSVALERDILACCPGRPVEIAIPIDEIVKRRRLRVSGDLHSSFAGESQSHLGVHE